MQLNLGEEEGIGAAHAAGEDVLNNPHTPPEAPHGALMGKLSMQPSLLLAMSFCVISSLARPASQHPLQTLLSIRLPFQGFRTEISVSRVNRLVPCLAQEVEGERRQFVLAIFSSGSIA